jgi:hypothetical protein
VRSAGRRRLMCGDLGGELSWFTKQLFGRHPTYQCAPLLVERQAARRAVPTLQATKRADLPSTAHLGTRQFP